MPPSLHQITHSKGICAQLPIQLSKHLRDPFVGLQDGTVMNMTPIAKYPLVVRLLTKLANTYYIMLLGETGSGKSTLLNMFVNFFRGLPQVRTALPEAKDLRAAVPTAHFAVTELEGSEHSERNAADRKCFSGWFHYSLTCRDVWDIP